MRLTRVLDRTVHIRPDELGAALWSFAYCFCLLCSYYILRPVREEMGIAGGVERLPWVFTATFVAMAAAVPVFGALAARYPRRTLLPVVYGFFVASILGLFAWLRSGLGSEWAPGAFFVWLSVFNLFVVSVFWSFMADLWSDEQARRLFGFIAAGGSAGALVGPSLTAVLVGLIGPINLLPVAAAVLAGALLCIRRLRRGAAAAIPGAPERLGWRDERGLGGGVLAGVALVLRSRYLLGICLFIGLSSTLATFVYFQQAHIVRASVADPGQRTSVFALIDFSVNALTIVLQLFLTGRLVVRQGLARTLGVLPALTLLGFAGLALAPMLAVLAAFQVLRRAAQYGVARPAREMLFTVVTREQKYKAKNVIDTVVYRGADAVGGWVFSGLAALGLGLTGIALAALPLAALWIAIAGYLGRHQEGLRGVHAPPRAVGWEIVSR
ncbi:MAG TPA: MFS transporter [Methylomirabilota bacterium]|nr:MFS transporter [Methylomirabilota bacterium]